MLQFIFVMETSDVNKNNIKKNEPYETQFLYHQGWYKHHRIYHWTPDKTSDLES